MGEASAACKVAWCVCIDDACTEHVQVCCVISGLALVIVPGVLIPLHRSYVKRFDTSIWLLLGAIVSCGVITMWFHMRPHLWYTLLLDHLSILWVHMLGWYIFLPVLTERPAIASGSVCLATYFILIRNTQVSISQKNQFPNSERRAAWFS